MMATRWNASRDAPLEALSDLSLHRVIRELLITVAPLLVLVLASFYLLQIPQGFATTLFTSSFVFLSLLLTANSLLYADFIEYVRGRHAYLAKAVRENRKNDFVRVSARVKARLDRPRSMIATTLRMAFLLSGAVISSVLTLYGLPSVVLIANLSLNLVRLLPALSLGFMLLTIVNALYLLVQLSEYARKRIASLLKYIEERTAEWPTKPKSRPESTLQPAHQSP